MSIKIAVVGYGNVGQGVITAFLHCPPLYPDMKLAGVFTRRPDVVRERVPYLRIPPLVYAAGDIYHLPTPPDVAILCGGSTNLLDEGQGPQWAKICNTVCSFDDHGRVPEYFAAMNQAAKRAGQLAAICTGWHPGTLSVQGLYANAFLGVLPHHFYGLTEKGGLSMGHTQHAKEVEGVADAVQYTHARPEAIERIRTGQNLELTPGDKIWREVFVVLKTGADEAEVRQAIVSMPMYYAPYQTKVEFVSQERLDEIRHERGMAHDGMTIAVGETSPGKLARLIYRCEYDSNPEGTARIMLACARAVVRLGKEGRSGAFTLLDIPPAYLSSLSQEELLRNFV